MAESEDNYSDAPEELTADQGIRQDEDISRAQKENKNRVVREGKERRRLWAQKKTPRPSKKDKISQDVAAIEAQQSEIQEEPSGIGGMLPNNIVQLLATREKQVFESDSEDEKKEVKLKSKRKKPKISGVETVILKEMPAAQCVHNSLEFLKNRRTQVSRSSAVLNNSNQALRFLSTSGLLGKN